MTRLDDLPAGWLTRFRRGVLSGAGLLLVAVAGCAVPSFAVWLVPGSDTSPASSAVKSGALLALAAAHGGIRLNDQQVSLVPLLVTGLLGWLIASQARRAESWSSVVGLTTGYGLAAGLLADWATLGTTRAPGLASALASAAFAGLVGACAYGAPDLWSRLADRHRRIVRAAGAVLCCYLGAGALLVAAALLMHLSTAIALQRNLAPGLAGLPIALLGVGLAPNAAVAGAGYLAGPGFQIGSHTQISVLATRHGPLPSFPLLAAVPSGGPATVVGLLAIVAVALLAGWLCVRLTRTDGGWSSRLLDVAAGALLAGAGLALLAGLAGGGIGSGALDSVGVRWWAAGGCASLLVLAAGIGWTVLEMLRPPAAVGNSETEPVRVRLRAINGSVLEPDRPDRQSGTTRPAASETGPAGDRSRNVS